MKLDVSASNERTGAEAPASSTIDLRVADCRDMLRSLPDGSADSIVTDPPYELGFMGKRWDRSGIAYDVDVWREALRVAKPGAHLLAFGGTRTYHRMACAIEDAGWEIRDCLVWMYGSGFPKSLNISKAIDAAAGAEREVVGHYTIGGNAGVSTADKGGTYGVGVGTAPPVEVAITAPATELAKQWDGWGTALKPAMEPIVMARKPLAGTVARNVTDHGCGGINVDGCRIATDWSERSEAWKASGHSAKPEADKIAAPPGTGIECHAGGRWPANVVLDEQAGELLDAQAGERKNGGANTTSDRSSRGYGGYGPRALDNATYAGDRGGASRFFYVAKTATAEREAGLGHLPRRTAGELTGRVDATDGLKSPRAGAGRSSDGRANHHPTVKPIDLMRWLCRLVTPPDGLIVEPFLGSGSTACAAALEGFRIVGCDLSAEYVEIARARVAHWERLRDRQLDLFAGGPR